MAITIEQNLKDYAPAFNDMEILLSDATNSGQPNYRYVFQIYVNTVLVATKKVLPDPSASLGYCDINEIVGSYIETEIAPYASDEGFEEGLFSPIVDVLVRFGNEFGSPTPTEYLNLANSGTVYAWAASFSYNEWVSRIQFSAAGAFSPWILTSGTTRHFLTYQLAPKVSLSNLGWAWCILDDPTDVGVLEIKTYDSADALIDTFNAITNVTTGTTSSKCQSVPIAPQSLNNILNANLSLGTQPIIDSSVSYYTIKILDTLSAAMSETITCTIEEPCRYTQYRLHFLNKLGGFDAYNFNARNQISTQVERKQYEKHVNRISIANNIVRDHQYDGKQDYYVRSQDSIKLRSDFLTYEENQWLKELITSPQVYLEFADGDEQNFKPVRILTNKWEEKITSIDKLFKLEIDVEFSHANRRQRR